MPGVPIAAIECAGASLNSEPAATRKLAWTWAGTSVDPFPAAWAFAIEVWDQPPSWFGGMPALDLQPEIARTVYAAFSDGVWGALSEGTSPETAVRAAFQRANDALAELKRSERGMLFAGTGACAAGVVATQGSAALAWIGRARVYRRREGRVELLTSDHTALPPGTDRPELDEATRKALPEVLARCLGAGGSGAEVAVTEIHAGDVFVVASAPRIEAAVGMLSDERAVASAHELACAVVGAAASAHPGHPLGVAILRAKT